MQIPSRCMEEQKHIVDELNCIVKIKEQRQQELQLLDNLIKFEFSCVRQTGIELNRCAMACEGCGAVFSLT